MRKFFALFLMLFTGAVPGLSLPQAFTAEAPGYTFPSSGGGSGTISSGTTNRVPRYTAATTIGDGTLVDDGTGTITVKAGTTDGTALALIAGDAAASSNHVGYTGGLAELASGTGSNGNGTNKNGGAGGPIYITAFQGGIATGTGISGKGGLIQIQAGVGGASSGATGTAGDGDDVSVYPGLPGAANGGTPGAYGKFVVYGKTQFSGQSDAVQFLLKGSSTQTSKLLDIQKSDGTPVGIKVTGAGTGYNARAIDSFAVDSGDGNVSKFFWYAGNPKSQFMSSDAQLAWISGVDASAPSADTYLSRATVSVLQPVAADGSTSPGTFRFVATTPAQIGANQDDYNPGGSSYFQRWSSDASRNVTGLTFTAAQVDGQTHLIVNVGAQNIVLKEQTTSTAANQFLNSTGADITLSAKQSALVIYDGTTQRWRVFKQN